FGKELCGCRFFFFPGQLPQLLIDAPFMAERVDELSVACAPEHILDGHQYVRPAGDRAFHHGVRVINVERDSHRRAAESLRCLAAAAFAPAEFITDEQLVTIKRDLAMHESLAVWGHH